MHKLRAALPPPPLPSPPPSPPAKTKTKAEATAPTEDYLLGETMLADYLEAGLEALGYDVEDLEDDHLK